MGTHDRVVAWPNTTDKAPVRSNRPAVIKTGKFSRTTAVPASTLATGGVQLRDRWPRLEDRGGAPSPRRPQIWCAHHTDLLAPVPGWGKVRQGPSPAAGLSRRSARQQEVKNVLLFGTCASVLVLEWTNADHWTALNPVCTGSCTAVFSLTGQQPDHVPPGWIDAESPAEIERRSKQRQLLVNPSDGGCRSREH